MAWDLSTIGEYSPIKMTGVLIIPFKGRGGGKLWIVLLIGC